MSDGEFADFLSACRGELQVKQTGIAECLKRRPYAYDIDQGLLTLGSEAHSMVVIGTYCVSRRTWLWGWANDSYSDAARERSASLKGLRDLTGFQVFADDGLMATASDALNFGGHRCSLFGSRRLLAGRFHRFAGFPGHPSTTAGMTRTFTEPTKGEQDAPSNGG